MRSEKGTYYSFTSWLRELLDIAQLKKGTYYSFTSCDEQRTHLGFGRFVGLRSRRRRPREQQLVKL